MGRFASLAAVASLFWLLLLLPAATAAPEDDALLYWLTAEEIDNNCRLLLFVERREISRLVQEVQYRTPQGRRFLELQLPAADYNAWLGEMQRLAENSADSLGCEGEGRIHLDTARMQANQTITQNLLLAVQSASSEDEDFKLDMMPHEQSAARIYDAYLQRLLGGELQHFATAQREAAMKRVPENAEGFDFGYIAEMSALMGSMERTLGELALEIAANNAGLAIRPHYTSTTEWVPALVDPNTGELVGTVWAEPGYFAVSGGRVAGYMLHGAEDDVRLEALGADAGLDPRQLQTTLLIPTSPAPEGYEGREFYQYSGWRDLSTAYDASHETQSCTTGSCWSFPGEVLATIIASTAESLAVELSARTGTAAGQPGKPAIVKTWPLLAISD